MFQGATFLAAYILLFSNILQLTRCASLLESILSQAHAQDGGDWEAKAVRDGAGYYPPTGPAYPNPYPQEYYPSPAGPYPPPSPYLGGGQENRLIPRIGHLQPWEMQELMQSRRPGPPARVRRNRITKLGQFEGMSPAEFQQYMAEESAVPERRNRIGMLGRPEDMRLMAMGGNRMSPRGNFKSVKPQREMYYPQPQPYVQPYSYAEPQPYYPPPQPYYAPPQPQPYYGDPQPAAYDKSMDEESTPPVSVNQVINGLFGYTSREPALLSQAAATGDAAYAGQTSY